MQRCEQVAKRVLEPRPVELGRVDLDEQGPQLPDPLAGFRRDLLERGRKVGRRSFGDGRQRVRDTGEVLDDPVVQVGGDPAALEVGGVDRLLEQLHPLALRALHAMRELPRQRELDQREQDERASAM